MAGSLGNDDEPIAAINVTPLVDVMLVLLVVFLIAAPVIYQSAIKVELPEAATGEKADDTPLDFSITKKGEVFWGKEVLNWETLNSKLRALGTRTRDLTATIRADEESHHGVVVKLMDTLRKNGLVRFALNVKTKKE